MVAHKKNKKITLYFQKKLLILIIHYLKNLKVNALKLALGQAFLFCLQYWYLVKFQKKQVFRTIALIEASIPRYIARIPRAIGILAMAWILRRAGEMLNKNEMLCSKNN